MTRRTDRPTRESTSFQSPKPPMRWKRTSSANFSSLTSNLTVYSRVCRVSMRPYLHGPFFRGRYRGRGCVAIRSIKQGSC